MLRRPTWTRLARLPRRWRGRLIKAALTFVGLGLVAWLNQHWQRSLGPAPFLTGYLLLTACFLLTMFGLRKRLAFLPGLGSARTWMQVHLYLGLATFGLFGMHVAWQWPQGTLELILALQFWVVGLSGVYGAWISRSYPRRLTSLGDEVIYERIPQRRLEIASQARALVLESATARDVLGRYYLNHLAAFLERPRGWGYVLLPTGRLKRQLIADIAGLDRYLGPEQRNAGRQLSDLVEQRDRIDYHAALQGRLKAWLFVHIGFTYSFLILAVFHGILVHAFSGGRG